MMDSSVKALAVNRMTVGSLAPIRTKCTTKNTLICAHDDNVETKERLSVTQHQIRCTYVERGR